MRGYGWCFRKGNVLNLGLGRLGERQLLPHVEGFLEFLKAADKVSFDLPARALGHAYLLYDRTQREVVGDGVLLIGEQVEDEDRRIGALADRLQATLADGSTVTRDDAYLKESIVSPNAKVVKGFNPGIMPQNFGTTLKPEQIDQLVEYMKSLK